MSGNEAASLESFVERILTTDYFILDQWQFEELAKGRRKARIKVVSDGLPPETLSHLRETGRAEQLPSPVCGLSIFAQ